MLPQRLTATLWHVIVVALNAHEVTPTLTEETTVSSERRLTPIYVSWSTFATFLDWVAAMAVIPHQIDRSVWASKFSGAVGAQLMPGLRFLGLLDGEAPRQP